MVRRRIPLGLLCALLLMLARVAVAGEDWWAGVLGSYQGPVMNAGEIQQLATDFALDADGKLVGRYRVEDTPPFDGELSDFHPDGPASGTFVWRDRFGAGIVHISFEPEHGRFVGTWGDAVPRTGHIFNGYRIRPPAVS